jgi:hypothetical protein
MAAGFYRMDLRIGTLKTKFSWQAKPHKESAFSARCAVADEFLRTTAVLGAWGTYHKLRQLSVPLVALEEERREAYRTLTIRERIQELEEQPPEARGPVGTYLDARWPGIVTALTVLYESLLRRREPAKFYTLASVVDHFIENRLPSDNLRIVAPTRHEGNMLATLLGDISLAASSTLSIRTDFLVGTGLNQDLVSAMLTNILFLHHFRK